MEWYLTRGNVNTVNYRAVLSRRTVHTKVAQKSNRVHNSTLEPTVKSPRKNNAQAIIHSIAKFLQNVNYYTVINPIR